MAANDSESYLLLVAQGALSACNWTIGEMAARWMHRWSRGRSDDDFGAMVGLSGDQVHQRRMVYERFADVRGSYLQLRWSHFYAALNWDDAQECLDWANEMQATVGEMKAWRRAQRGEDLREPEPPSQTGRLF